MNTRILRAKIIAGKDRFYLLICLIKILVVKDILTFNIDQYFNRSSKSVPYMELDFESCKQYLINKMKYALKLKENHL